MPRFGGLDYCCRASAAAAAVTGDILAGASRCLPGLVVAFDAPFYGLAPLLPAAQRGRLVNVARATAALHAPADRERAEWERAGLLAAASAGGHVAATSRHMRQHLTSAYAIPGDAVTDLVNGLTPPSGVQHVQAHVVGGGVAAFQQAGHGQDERATADRGDRHLRIAHRGLHQRGQLGGQGAS
jgi:hypothetical protein